MDLATNGVVITDAIKTVQGKMDHLNTAEKKLLQDIRKQGQRIEEIQIEEETEANGEHAGNEGKTTNGILSLQLSDVQSCKSSLKQRHTS